MEPIIGKSKHGELTIDQLAEIQPGLGRIMPEVSDAYWYAYYAAKGGNFALARYYVKKVASLLRLCATTRPKYAKLLGAFETGSLGPVLAAVEARDFAAFEAAYHRGVAVANRMHVETGHPEIVWKLPPEPPRHLALGPPEA
jgi:hypothetical protein